MKSRHVFISINNKSTIKLAKIYINSYQIIDLYCNEPLHVFVLGIKEHIFEIFRIIRVVQVPGNITRATQTKFGFLRLLSEIVMGYFIRVRELVSGILHNPKSTTPRQLNVEYISAPY